MQYVKTEKDVADEEVGRDNSREQFCPSSKNKFVGFAGQSTIPNQPITPSMGKRRREADELRGEVKRMREVERRKEEKRRKKRSRKQERGGWTGAKIDLGWVWYYE